jgi:hypothetical protein
MQRRLTERVYLVVKRLDGGWEFPQAEHAAGETVRYCPPCWSATQGVSCQHACITRQYIITSTKRAVVPTRGMHWVHSTEKCRLLHADTCHLVNVCQHTQSWRSKCGAFAHANTPNHGVASAEHSRMPAANTTWLTWQRTRLQVVSRIRVSAAHTLCSVVLRGPAAAHKAHRSVPPPCLCLPSSGQHDNMNVPQRHAVPAG